LRLVALVLLVLVGLCLLAWLLRGPLFEGMLRERAGQELSALLGADVSVGAVEGDWLTSIRVSGVELRGREGDLLREVQALSVDAEFSLWDLAHGDLAGLRTARVHAQRVRIDTTGRPPGSGAPAGTATSPPVDFGPLAALLPRGALVEVSDLEFGAGDQRRRGPFQLTVDPGAGPRHVRCTHQELSADVDLTLRTGGAPSMSGTVRARDPAQLAACLGAPPLPVSGGEISATGGVTLSPLAIDGTCVLDGLRSERASLQRSEVSLHLDARRLEVPAATVDLDGLRLRAARCSAPSPLGGGIALREIAGEVDLHVERLEPWRDLLPAEVRALLPLQGDVHAWLDQGLLHVGACRFTAPDLVVALDRGVLPLDDRADFAHRDVELGFTVDLPQQRQLELGGTTVRAAGRITGRLGGSLSAPRGSATVELTRVACEYGSTGRVSGNVSLGDGVLKVDQFAAEEIAAGGVAAERGSSASSLHGDLRIAFAAAGRPLTFAAEMNGRADPAVLAAAGLGPDPVARTQPFPFSLGAEIALADSGTLHVARCHVQGPVTLDVQGEVPLAPGGRFDAELTATDQDLDWSSLLLAERLTGSLSVHARAGGTFEQPALQLDVAGRLTSSGRVAGQWPAALGAPPAAPITLELHAQHGDDGIEVKQLLLATASDSATAVELKASGRIPLHFGGGSGLTVLAPGAPLLVDVTARGPGEPQRNLPWTLQTEFAVDAQQTAWRSLSFAAGPGALRGSGTVAAGFADLLAPAKLKDAAVDARARLDALDLAALPASLVGLATAEGTLRGEVTLRGTLARPEPGVELQVEGAQVRAQGAPRVTDVTGAIRGDLRHLELRDVRGRMGAAPVALEATVTSKDPTWADPEAIAVEAHLTGQQALVVNTPTLRVRGDVDLTANGTLGKLRVSGTVDVTTGRYAQRITAVPGPDALSSRGGAGAGPAFELSLLDPPFGQRIEFDVKVRTKRDFEVRTHLFDADLNLDLRLLGDAANARLAGNVAGSKGTLRLPGATMALRSLLVSFRENDPLHPQLQLLAEGRRHSYQIQLAVRGTLASPEVVFTSSPGLPAEDLLVLVTTGSLPDRLRDQGTRGQAALVGSYLAEQLAGWYLGGETTDQPGETIFDRFSVETGREISDKGLETVVVEFKLSDRLALQGERDVYEDINGGLCIRWRFK
jgi:hypothetical protein